MECISCKDLSGEKRISPGKTIYSGKYWYVEHAYPCKLKGWLVIVLKRHVEALHELSGDEFIELGNLQQRCVIVLKKLLDCEKEYVACLGEAVRHIHFHIIAVNKDLPEDYRGPNIFKLLNSGRKKEIREFCKQVIQSF